MTNPYKPPRQESEPPVSQPTNLDGLTKFAIFVIVGFVLMACLGLLYGILSILVWWFR
ncbi:MAG: hypothetical protein MI861_18830 [Pirellulales bacterium]|nr:hypothetical protein [Pirellulales bacterium]